MCTEHRSKAHMTPAIHNLKVAAWTNIKKVIISELLQGGKNQVLTESQKSMKLSPKIPKHPDWWPIGVEKKENLL